jgi:uncharacterized coiled-coil protein SlyX
LLTVNQNKIPVSFEKIDEPNEKFIRMKVWIANVGENHNASYFSKETLEQMAHTLPYTPVVGYIGKNEFNEKDFRAHEEELVKIGGELDFKYLGFAYGFVPSDPEWKFESKVCPDGILREYLTCTIFVWKKWSEVIEIFERDGWSKKHSMELTDCEGYIDENDKLFHFTSATFDGLCILGKDIEPGIPYSTIEKISFKRFNNQLKTMIEEYNKYFSTTSSSKGGETEKMNEHFLKKDEYGTGDKIEIDNSKDAASDTPWGEVNKTKLRNDILKASNYKSLVKEAYLIVEDGWEDAPSEKLKYPHHVIKDGKLVLSIPGCEAALQRLHQEGITSGSAINHLKKHYKTLGLSLDNFSAHEKEVSRLSKKDIAAKFKLTAGQMFDEFNRVLSEVTYETEDWYGDKVERPRYYLRDYDESFVYVVDCMNDYMDMKLSYSTEGDNIKIDYESATRIKYTPIDWDGGVEDDPDYDGDVVIDSVQDFAKKFSMDAKVAFEKMKSDFEAKTSDLETKISVKEDVIISLNEKFQKLQEESSSKDQQIESLSKFKKEHEEKIRKEKVESLFTKFAKVLSKEEMDELREKEPSFETYEAFEKEIKSFAADKLITAHKEEKPEFSSMAIPNSLENNSESEQSKDVWSRLSKKQ